MLFCLVCAVLGAVCAQKGSSSSPNYRMLWAEFKKEHQKVYGVAGVEEEHDERFEIFKANVHIIQDVNSKNLSYTLDVNQFADLTASEFASQYTCLGQPDTPLGQLSYLGRDTYSGNVLATSVDWTTKGVVTPVKNQGPCGSCWAFSTTGALEAAWQNASGALVSLSEQQFVDCEKRYHGCNGGWHAFEYPMEHAICTTENYAYTAREGACKASSCTAGIPHGRVTGYKDVATNMQALMQAVEHIPVAVAIQADSSAFQFYKTGVLSADCGTSINHAVLAVGYGTESDRDYWKLKNSWGVGWGDSGYIKVSRGKGATRECGILVSHPSYPVVSGQPDPSPPSPSPPSPPQTMRRRRRAVASVSEGIIV